MPYWDRKEELRVSKVWRSIRFYDAVLTDMGYEKRAYWFEPREYHHVDDDHVFTLVKVGFLRRKIFRQKVVANKNYALLFDVPSKNRVQLFHKTAVKNGGESSNRPQVGLINKTDTVFFSCARDPDDRLLMAFTRTDKAGRQQYEIWKYPRFVGLGHMDETFHNVWHWPVYEPDDSWTHLKTSVVTALHVARRERRGIGRRTNRNQTVRLASRFEPFGGF